jgi:hypothetical protein
MPAPYEIGELVHIPQAVTLIDCRNAVEDDPQLTIPLRIEETAAPRVGIVTDASLTQGYVRVYCDGESWAVKNESLYSLNKVIK